MALLRSPRWFSTIWNNSLGTPSRVAASVCAGWALAWAAAATALMVWGYEAPLLPFLNDNQHYFYISERAASGIAPHVSAFDPKTHLSSLLAGGAIWVGRLFGAPAEYSARAFSIAIAATTVGLAWLTARRTTRSLLGGHLAAGAFLGFMDFLYNSAQGGRPKVVLVFFLFATMYAATFARRSFLTGLLAGAAGLCWQPGLVVLGGAGLEALLRKGRWTNVAWLVGGAAVALLAYETYFAWHGALREQWAQSVTFAREYMGARDQGFETIGDAWAHLRRNWGRGFRDFWPPIATMTLVVLAPLLLLFGPRRQWRWLRRRRGWVLWLSAGLVALAFTLRNHQGTPDVFILLPFIAIGFAALTVTALGVLRRLAATVINRRASMVATRVAAVAAAIWLGQHLTVEAAQRTQVYHRMILGGLGFTLADQQLAAEAVEVWLNSGLTVYGVGSTHLFAMIGESNFNQYGLLFKKMGPYLTGHGQHPYIPLRDGEPPDVILISREPFPAFRKWVSRNYQGWTIPVITNRVRQLWVRKPAPGEPPPRGDLPLELVDRVLKAADEIKARRKRIKAEWRGESIEPPVEDVEP